MSDNFKRFEIVFCTAIILIALIFFGRALSEVSETEDAVNILPADEKQDAALGEETIFTGDSDYEYDKLSHESENLDSPDSGLNSAQNSFTDESIYENHTNSNNLSERNGGINLHTDKIFENDSELITYEQDVFSHSENSTANMSIIINIAEKPNMTIYNRSARFIFNISYSEGSFECNFSIVESASFEINFNDTFRNAYKEYSINLSNSNYRWDIRCLDLSNESTNAEASGNFSVAAEYLPKISFYADKNKSFVNESIAFFVNISLSLNKSIIAVLDFNDGSAPNITAHGSIIDLYYITNYKYVREGNFTPLLNIYINGVLSNETSIRMEVIQNFLSISDGEKPEINLIYPENNAKLRQDRLEFVFSAKDNIKVSNCTFGLYYYNNSARIGTLIYQEVKNSPQNGQNLSAVLEKFDAGDYSWDVGCYDNSSNYHEKGRDFVYLSEQVTEIGKNQTELLTNSANKSSVFEDEIGSLISQINDFLIREEKYGADEKDAVESIGMIENLRFYKKKLLQIKADLEHNLGFISDISKREKREKELKSELDEIRANIPVELTVIGKKTFSKATIDSDLKEIARDYLAKKGALSKERDIESLADRIRKGQGSLTIESDAKKIEIEYLNSRSENIVLIKKEIRSKNAEFEGIIEVIPKTVSPSAGKVFFINKNSIIREDPIFEISIEHVIDGKIIYYIRDGEFSEIEKIDTIGFTDEMFEKRGKITGISGFSVIYDSINKGVAFYFSWIAVAILIISCIAYYLKAKRLARFKNNKEFKKLMDLLKTAKDAIGKKETENARDLYFAIKQTYTKLNGEMRKYVYKGIIKLQVEIDRMEISILINECIRAIEEKRKEDAKLIYSKIKPIYNRLPSALKERAYTKIIPHLMT